MKFQKTKINRALLLAFGFSAVTGACSALAQETTMGAMVVTATRTEIEEFKAPANISVITRETLENKHYTDLGEALKDVPGVTIQNYGSSGANYTANSFMINGTDKIVVLIDGMRANTNGSTFSRFSASELVDMSMIERIEVLKGSASTLYGSDAQGGVVNIITRRSSEGQTSTSLGYTGGSNDLGKYNVRHAGSKNGLYWALSAQKRASGDYTDGSGKTIPESVKDTAFNIQLGKKFDDGVSSIQLDISKYDSDYVRPNNLSTGSLTPTYGSKDNSRIGLAYVQKLNNRLTNRLSIYQNTNKLKDNSANWASRWFMDLETIGANDQLTYRGTDHVLTGGFDYYDDKIKNYYSSGTQYSGKSLSSTGFFIQDEWTFAPGWTLTPGVRSDRHSVYGSHNSPSVSLNYIANNRTNYYLTYKEYFVAPNQFQLFSPYGSMDLTPETGSTTEAGVKHKFSSTLNASLNVYSRRSKDAVAYNSATSKYGNVGREEAQGASASVNAMFMRYYTATVGYAYTHINPQTGANSNRDGQLPRDAWNIGLNYTKEKLSLDTTARGIYGRKGRKNDAYPDKQTEFWVVDLAANYAPYKGVKVFAKVNNVFDKYYTERTYEADPAKWYPQPGRNFLAGLEYTF